MFYLCNIVELKKYMNGGQTSSPQVLKEGAVWLQKGSMKDPCVMELFSNLTVLMSAWAVIY